MTKYNAKKMRNQVVATFTEKHVPEKTQKRISECGNWMEFITDYEEDKRKLYQANFCKNRFCPMCAWRSAQKDALKISVLIDYLEAEHGKAFIFVTLTAPNVLGSDLPAEIDRYNDAFKKLTKRKEIEKINQGYIRKLEITYNKERDDYHPHFHCVFAVNKSYFTSRDYVKQDKWLELWRDVMNEPSITQVDVRRVKKSNGVDERDKAINEVAKYAAKDEDYTVSQNVFDMFYNALKGRQILTFNGLFKEANKKYKAHELDHYINVDTTEYFYVLFYRWAVDKYEERKRRELTEIEKVWLKGGTTIESKIDQDKGEDTINLMIEDVCLHISQIVTAFICIERFLDRNRGVPPGVTDCR